jgi:hypothetical protein
VAVKKVIISVEDQFSRPLQNYERAISNAEKSTSQFGRAATNTQSGFSKAAADLAHLGQSAQFLYQTFSGVFRQANEWAQVGLSAERNKIAFQSLAGSADEYAAKIKAITDATRGMVTEGEAAGTAYRLQRFGLADTADEMERFMRTVSIVSAINPQLGGTAEAINQIQLTLSNMSFMRLDQLGVSAGQVRARMAELKAEAKGLSDEQAFQTAVMEQLDQQASAVGDSILEMNDASERFAARWRGFKEDWGLKIATGFEAIAQSAEGAAAAIKKVGWADFIQEAANQTGLDAIGTVIQTVQDIQKTTLRDTSSWRNEMLLASMGQYSAMTVNPFLGKQKPSVNWQEWGLNADLTPRRASIYGGTTPDLAYYQSGGVVQQPLAGYGQYNSILSRQRQEYDQQQYYQLRNAPTVLTKVSGGFQGQGGFFNLMGGFTPKTGLGDKEGTPNFSYVENQLKNAAGYSREIENNLTSASDKWGSLNEKFGIAPAGLDTDLFNSMSEALRSAGIEGDAAANAIKAFQLQSGMATGASEVFSTKLQLLTEQFGAGKLSAAEYALEVQNLGNMDYTWVDSLVQGFTKIGDLQGAQNAVEAAKSTMTPGGQVQYWNLLTPLGQGTETGAGGGDKFAEAENSINSLISKVQSIPLEGSTALLDFSSTAAEQMGAFSSDAIEKTDAVVGSLSRLEGKHISVIMDIIPALSGEGAAPVATSASVPSSVEQFAAGGFTGRGGRNEIAGVVHKNEYVLSESMLSNLKWQRAGGSERGGEFLPVVIKLSDRTLYDAIVDVRRQKGQ